MRAENYVIKGKYFIPFSKDKKEMESVNNLIMLTQTYFRGKGYIDQGPSGWLHKYFELVFFRFNLADFKISKIKSFFGKSKSKQVSEFHLKELNSTRSDIPAEIKIYLRLGEYKEIGGIMVEVTSKPVKYFKIAQLNQEADVSKEKYSFIVNENKETIDGFAKANHLITLEDPKPINLIVETKVSLKLGDYGFNKVSKLLESGRRSLEIGKDKEGIGDLLGVIENFFYELVKRMGGKPLGRDKPEKNLNILCNKGWISDSIRENLKSSLYNLIYRKLKDKDHKKESLDLFDLRLYFDITENMIDYLLEKCWRYKIKINTQKPKQ